MDDTLERYIERALQLADERRDELDEQDLAEIARELGLTDADLARVEQAIGDHLDRGRGYADHRMWDDAIREFEEAAILAPARADARVALAGALTERWAETDFPDDKRRAEELVRAVIDREPSNRDAYALLARLNPTSAPPPPTTSAQAKTAPDASRARTFRLVGLTFLLALSGAVAGVAITFIDSTTTPPPPSPSAPAAPIPETDPYQSGETDPPVEFAGKEGLTFTTRRSRLARYPEKAFYTLWGDVEVTGDIEVEEIELSVKLRNEAGEVVKHHVEKVWATHEARLRKGDHGRFTMLIDVPREVASVALEVTRDVRHNASGPYAESPLITPRIEVKVPEHLKLEIRERSASFSPMMNGPKGFFEADWEFENTGDVPIRELTYTVGIYDENGEQMSSKKKLATFASHPPIGPGEVFLQSTIEMLDKAHDRYELTIIELE